MLKKTLLAAVVFSVTATAVQANELSGYVTASFGKAKAEVPKIVKDELKDWEFWGGNTSSDRKDTAYKINFGLKLNPYLAGELQYIDLGSANYKGRDSGSFIGGSWVDSEKFSFKSSGFGANLVGVYPVNNFSVFAKVGYHLLQTKSAYKYDYSSTSFSAYESSSKTLNQWTPSFGIGVSYAMIKDISLVAEYERYQGVADKKVNLYSQKLSFKHDIDFASIGLRYTF